MSHMKLKTIIVEDEPLSQKALKEILNRFCADSIELLEVAGSVEQAISSIEKHKPHLVFLDITLGSHIDGAFDVLRACHPIDFKVVFTTSSKQPENILMAFHDYGAKKYLLKPLDIDDVVESVNLVQEEIKMKLHETDLTRIIALLNAIGPAETKNKIPIPVRNGVQYISVADIVMFRSDLNDTLVFLNNCTNIKTSRNLKYFEVHHARVEFIRVSRSHIINKNHVQRYSAEDGGTIYLTCGCTVPLSKNNSTDFFEALGR
ncbi:MAG: LytTR family DNA-binding domain-containing protein [Bacteroidetes bacterium]|nr:LytTR family DNA-binding domain-containing protein [Bacteroidota bacterium]